MAPRPVTQGRGVRLAAAALLAVACLHWPDPSPNAGTAKIRFDHSLAFDGACSLLRGYPIDPSWRAELEARSPELGAAWSDEALPILRRAHHLAGAPLTGERRVRLTLCDIPSSSRFGATVNMRHALSGFTDRPVSLRYKALTASHELLHPLVSSLDLSRSAMLATHADEPERVRDHLHLLALLKAASLDLGRRDAFEEMVAVDSRLPYGGYRRAWEIVNASPEAHLPFVEEVRRAN